MLHRIKNFFSLTPPPNLRERLEEMVRQTPVPVFWLFGKTQSGKTSVVRFLTGAEQAEIGRGYKPCTRFSREYRFPNEDAPLISFLDTRGLDEPGYDPREDIDRFHDKAHVLVVTVRLLDQALAGLVEHLRQVRAAEPDRPVVLLLTTLHEVYPQQQHLEPYPFRAVKPGAAFWTGEDECRIPQALREALAHQLGRFEGLFDFALPIDLTLPEEGYRDPCYGGEALRALLIDVLPHAFRQTLVEAEGAHGGLRELALRQARPYVIKYSGLAAAAGAMPVPLVDLALVPAIQARMVTQLAKLYGQSESVARFKEVAAALGLGMAAGGAARVLTRYLPFLGATAGNALAWGAATLALGHVCCYYFAALRRGAIPSLNEVAQHYQEQVRLAASLWRKTETA